MEASIANKLGDGTVQVTAASQVLPDRGETVLPPTNPGIGSPSVLDEQEAAAGLQHAKHFAKRARDIGDAAQRPRGYNRVYARLFQRDRRGAAFEQFDVENGSPCGFAGHRQEFA